MKEYELIYRRPASTWLESLPLGNGRIGAMVFGDPLHERIALNEDTLWSGYAKNNNEKERYPYYERARDLILQGNNFAAQKILDENFTGEWNESYMPLGDMRLDFQHRGEICNYQRKLHLNSGVMNVSYTVEGVLFERECFISFLDNILVLKLSSARPQTNCDISFTSLLKHSTKCSEEKLYIEGQCPSHAEPNYIDCKEHIFYSEKEQEQGISFCGIVAVENKDGTVLYEKNRICLRNCSQAVLYFSVKSNFERYDIRPSDSQIDCRKEAEKCLCRVRGKSYEQLLQAHTVDFSSYFTKTELEINHNECGEKSTDQRLKDFQKTKSDDYLIELIFHYGKYLLISGSRPGTQPMNLQGIWNESLVPPWSSNYTLNINTQMNYWLAEPLNLPEMHEPLLRLIEELSVSGEDGARKYYNARGFVTHHNCDIWQHTNPVGKKETGRSIHSFWPMSSGWLCRHLYEHYEYTQDLSYLRDKAFPVLKKACRFYADVLTEKNNELIFCPTTSPENKFLSNGQSVYVSQSSAMTVSIIRELFTFFIESAEILGIDDDFVDEISAKLKMLQKVKIGREGNVLEWSEEVEEFEVSHRHLSHLYFAYPNDAAYNDPSYIDATVKSLIRRSNEGTGWSLAWKVCLWGRLGYGEYAEECLRNQLRSADINKNDILYSGGGGTYPNLFCAHPPFQIDGNMGVCAGILEMLVSSHNKKVYLLSALPEGWKSGKLKGIKVKGGFLVNLEWEDKKIKSLDVYSDRETVFVYVVDGKTTSVKLQKGMNLIL